MLKLKFKKLSDTAIKPTKAHSYDAGFDIYADENVIIQPNGHTRVKSGIAIQIPQGYVGLLTARSGINHKSSLRVLLGIIDAGYIGDISVLIDNRKQREETKYLQPAIKLLDYSFNYKNKYFLDEVYEIKKGDKIAQLVIVPIPDTELEEVEDFEKQDERGENGFGSTSNVQ